VALLAPLAPLDQRKSTKLDFNRATFTLKRVGNLSGQVTVNWTTGNNAAAAGSNYVASSGQVVFQDGEAQKTVTVTVNGDSAAESNETFQLLLSTTPPGYAVGVGQAIIVDDDVGISVDDATATEGEPKLGQRQRHLDRGQRHRQGLPVRRCGRPHLRLPERERHLRPGPSGHQPPGHRRPPADPLPTTSHHKHHRHAHAAAHWLPPEVYDWAPIDVTRHGKRTRA